MVVEKIILGCIGNKKTELKILLPIIKDNINDETIFVEAFCGSSIVSYNVFKKLNIKKILNSFKTPNSFWVNE